MGPTALSCEDQADRFTLASNNRDRPCLWVLRNNASTAQINRRCALPLVGGSTVVSDHCPATCGTCPIEITTAAPTSSAPTSVPTSAPTSAPTSTPTSALSCEDQADRFTLESNGRNRPCSWVLRNNASTAQINRRCALPLVGGSTVVSDHCPATCGICSGITL